MNEEEYTEEVTAASIETDVKDYILFMAEEPQYEYWSVVGLPSLNDFHDRVVMDCQDIGGTKKFLVTITIEVKEVT